MPALSKVRTRSRDRRKLR